MDRSAPSAVDLNGLRYNLIQNFVEYAECGNVRFALVIEDVVKAKTFLKDFDALIVSLQLITTAQSEANWFNDWQNATKITLKNYLGSASDSGIGFYISNNTQKTTYTKLNP